MKLVKIIYSFGDSSYLINPEKIIWIEAKSDRRYIHMDHGQNLQTDMNLDDLLLAINSKDEE